MARTYIVGDIGNSTIDFGLFCKDDLVEGTNALADGIARPIETKKVSTSETDFPDLSPWLCEDVEWRIGSVNAAASGRLTDWIREYSTRSAIQFVRHSDISMPSSVRVREQLGIDRLAAAFAANRLRKPLRPAVVISSGSAITVNVISADGVFLGGMITAGMQLNFESLASKTDQLPRVRVGESTPPMIGDDTVSAMQAGVFWFAAKGIDGVLTQLEQELAGPIDVFGTGGSFGFLLSHLERDVRIESNLVLSGLAMASP